jgi:hypothetical protein
MSTVPQDHNPRARWVTYTAVGLLMVALAIFMVSSYRGAPGANSSDAQAKAQTLSQAITQAGFPAPDVDAIAGVLGDDGGAVCDSPNEALSQNLLKAQLANGAAGPGMRPVTVDKIVVGGQRLIIQTYCPDQLAEFDEFVATLKFADVATD